ncbi:hypothetical protein J7E62_06275 [Variovorax paradoxus]|nr:hypothetical protein [Variovorax paradoxus]
MYASKTDYSKLYSPAYFGKAQGVASFDAGSFCENLVQFCGAKRIMHVVDVGSGSGALAQHLRKAGLDVLSCDFEPATVDSIHFDLSGRNDDAEEIHRRIHERTGGCPWLVTCLDVLEHIDAEDVFAAVRNLHIICSGYLIASISTRPSSRDNRYHATILPLRTWMEILKTTGFQVDDETIFRSSRQVRRDFSNSSELCLVSHWAKVDPFCDIDQGEPNYLLLSVSQVKANFDARAGVERFLDIAYRHRKRQQFDLANPPRVGLNIHHPQDFILLRPLLDVLPRDKVIALVRTEMLQMDELSLIRGFFARCGVSLVQYGRAEEIRWPELDLQWLLSGGESSVSVSHILSRQLVEAAKLNDVTTLQLQHGIWVEAFSQRLISFGSDLVLSWGSKYADFFRKADSELAGKIVHRSATEAQKFRAMGGAKFTDSLLCPSPESLRWRLGIDSRDYRLVALLGTNLLWSRHRVDRDDSRRRLAKMIDSTPDVFFIIKLHPSERAPHASELSRPNSLVLDDIVLGSMDLHVSRILAGVDVVISSLSTLLLDAAVAGKPCIQYDTRNDYSYLSIEPVAIERIPSLLSRTGERLEANEDLVRHYADSACQPFYRNLADLFLENKFSAADTKEAASFYSIAVTVEDLSASKESLRIAGEVQEQEIQALRERASAAEDENLTLCGEREGARAAAAEAHALAIKLAQETGALRERFEAERERFEVERQRVEAELQKIEAERAKLAAIAVQLQAMERSKSWRVTAPLRRMRAWLQIQGLELGPLLGKAARLE